MIQITLVQWKDLNVFIVSGDDEDDEEEDQHDAEEEDQHDAEEEDQRDAEEEVEEDPQFIAKENLMTKIAKTNARHDLTELGHQFEDFIIYCTFRGINCAYVNFLNRNI